MRRQRECVALWFTDFAGLSSAVDTKGPFLSMNTILLKLKNKDRLANVFVILIDSSGFWFCVCVRRTRVGLEHGEENLLFDRIIKWN